jgi:hypothetical protein
MMRAADHATATDATDAPARKPRPPSVPKNYWELPPDPESPLPERPWQRRRELRRRRVYRLTALLHEGHSTYTIAAKEGISDRRLRSIFAAAGVSLPTPPNVRRLPGVAVFGDRALRLDRITEELGMTPGAVASLILKNALAGDGSAALRLLGHVPPAVRRKGAAESTKPAPHQPAEARAASTGPKPERRGNIARP